MNYEFNTSCLVDRRISIYVCHINYFNFQISTVNLFISSIDRTEPISF